ncbi:hypothetical protein KY41_10685 [Latilactobacillus sakei]|uniref:hypothetical protein n=1 Tax=Latilactobacillus sakei TaxID=1599 RepID=UPI0005058864|nr:hypothetical protein KY41_10685 [Latilactobacillus sakei]
MNNETKRNVFEEFADKWAGLDDERYEQYLKQYDAALPDDLPVIPKEVGEYIQWGKKYDFQLYTMYYSPLIQRPGYKKLTDDAQSWIIANQNTFATAWVLSVWCIEETGEIVKLEAEK